MINHLHFLVQTLNWTVCMCQGPHSCQESPALERQHRARKLTHSLPVVYGSHMYCASTYLSFPHMEYVPELNHSSGVPGQHLLLVNYNPVLLDTAATCRQGQGQPIAPNACTTTFTTIVNLSAADSDPQYITAFHYSNITQLSHSGQVNHNNYHQAVSWAVNCLDKPHTTFQQTCKYQWNYSQKITIQFWSTLFSDKLDIPTGYVKGGTKVWIRTESNVQNLYIVVQCFITVPCIWCSHLISIVECHSSEQFDSNSSARGPVTHSLYSSQRGNQKLWAA